ncbi:MAG: DNA cytosine methyltransferase [Methanothrix sp.]|nr:DNA cytosine methyltransferase [Methanothrix sp.]MDD4448701.1 DNA cytosine methyltransferase [Methanothrix sp.]
MPKKRPIAIDLFSGSGGLTLGLKQAGFRVIGAVECDSLAAETYRVNHKNTVLWETDIRALSISDVKGRLKLKTGELDLLAGCPPCQGFSSMRTLNGKRNIVDPRNDLVFEFLRFIKEIEPKAIMMENVPGLAKDGRLAAFCEEIKRLGYFSKCEILDAANFGVPQRRHRMVLLATKYGAPNFASPDTKRLTVKETISFLPPAGESEDPLHNLAETRSSRILNLIKIIPKDGGSRKDIGAENQLDCHKKCNGFKDVYGRMSWNDVAPTITGGCVNPSKGRFLHPEYNRAITLREAALLQTFPLDYYFSLRRGKMPAAELIGNSLPPEFIRRHAIVLKEYLGTNSFGLQKNE